MAKRPRKSAGLPTKEELLDFVRENPAAFSRREIARAFNVAAPNRSALRDLLRTLEEEGLVERRRGRRLAQPGQLPSVAVIEITAIDAEGEVLARPVSWRAAEPPPRIYLAPVRGRPAPGPGDKVLARLTRLDAGNYEARTMRRLEGGPTHLLGVYALSGATGRLRPTDRRYRGEFTVAAADSGGAKPGEIVRAETLGGRVHGLAQARIVERLGALDDPRSASLVAIHTHGIPTEFSREAKAKAARPAPIGKRDDLRTLNLVTIDDEDARDFDDAVWAEPDADPSNPGGWHLVVAIADVAWYVQPGDALDLCGRERGNSVYFPDRVVPMLPEALSNGLCSLNPSEDRPCLAVHLWLDKLGQKRRHYFVRALMRSAARLTYAEVEAAHGGQPVKTTTARRKKEIAALYGAFDVLTMARHERGTLDLDLPERRIVIDPAGRIEKVEPRPRYDSHRLIEEFMIVANVAAAETLEHLRQPCMYRVHEQPPAEKVEALRSYLASLGYRLAKGQALRPRHFSQIVKKVEDTPHSHAVNEAILRAQAQAIYSPDNLGHFGLALSRYSHFTSPIRRYADLLVHRALIAGLHLGEGGLTEDAESAFAEIGKHISMTERRAAMAERNALDRLTTAFLADKVGAVFDARISGVIRAALFVTENETGANGIVPALALGDDFFRFDETRKALIGRHTRTAFVIGDRMRVRLIEANPVTGNLMFAPETDEPTRPARVRGRGTGTKAPRKRPGGEKSSKKR